MSLLVLLSLPLTPFLLQIGAQRYGQFTSSSFITHPLSLSNIFSFYCSKYPRIMWTVSPMHCLDRHIEVVSLTTHTTYEKGYLLLCREGHQVGSTDSGPCREPLCDARWSFWGIGSLPQEQAQGDAFWLTQKACYCPVCWLTTPCNHAASDSIQSVGSASRRASLTVWSRPRAGCGFL